MRGLLLSALLAAPAAPRAAAPYLPPPGTGVTVLLRNEKEIAGTLLGERDGAVWVGVDQGEVGLEPAEIVLVRAQDNDDAEYRRRAARLGRDAGGWWALALWARERGLSGSAEDAARRVVELSPEHAGARALLGQEKAGGEWLSKEDALRAKGFIEYRGKWVKREELLALERARLEAAREERLERLLLLMELRYARSPQPVYAAPFTLWPFGGRVDHPDDRLKGDYTVPWRRLEPFQPSFHEGYFLRREPPRD